MLDIGDVCLFEITYTKTDDNLKIWIDTAENVEITIVDGYSAHPYSLNSSQVLKYYSKLMYEGDEFEVGDYWFRNNLTFGGKAYIFIKSTSNYGYSTFYYG